MSRRLLVEADGGSRGNPGPAGYGSVVRDAGTGEVLAEVSAPLGHTTNNVAEYSGLIAGLRAAATIAPGADTEVRMDSKLVVEQMSGRWQIKHPALRPLAAQAREAARSLGRVTYTWVPRAHNAHADRLANEAMDAAAMDAAAHGGGGGRRPRARRPAPGDAEDVRGASRAGGGNGAAVRDAPVRPGPGWAHAAGRPTTLLLLRHGETPWSAERRFAGSTDIPLTENGTRQAKAAAARLAARSPGQPGAPGAIAAIVASPLRRTRQTAAAVSATTGLPVVTDAAWAEVDFGEWEGLSHAEASERWPAEMAAWQADTEVAPPGGESFAAATRRVLRGLEALLAAHPGECVLVVSHVTPIKVVLLHALQAPPTALRRMYLDVACLCEADWYPDGTGVVRCVNDTAHLQPQNGPRPPMLVGAAGEPAGRSRPSTGSWAGEEGPGSTGQGGR